MKQKILITGGAGYIGSHVAKQLLEQDEDIIIIDNLSTGSQKTLETLAKIKPFEFIELDLNAFDQVRKLIQEKNIETILHFAAFSIVSESVHDPLKYYINNTLNTTNLIRAAVEANVKKFIFSSTAAVYGEPAEIPQEGIDEAFARNPINPYGMSKLMSETVLMDTAKAYPELKYIIFRYFNVAGASYDFSIGECHHPETHLLPLIAKATLSQKSITVFGENFPTQDGTAVRDYIHVEDLAQAHIDAIVYLDLHESDIFNVGYGQGHSVKEVIQTMKDVAEVDIQTDIGLRRDGDPAILVANANKIISKMQWQPKYNDIKLICKSAYMWEKMVD